MGCMLVMENAPDQKAVYGGRWDALILFNLMNAGEIVSTGMLGCRASSPMLTDANGPSGNWGTGHQSHRGTLQQRRVPNPHCQTSAWLRPARTQQPAGPPGATGAPELGALTLHPKRSTRAAAKVHNSQPAWLCSHFYRAIPGPGEITAISQMGIFHCRF